MSERIEILRRPSWSAHSTYFARLIDEQTGQHRDCWHCHSRTDLAERCAARMLDKNTKSVTL